MLNSKKKPDSGSDKVRGQTGAGTGARTEPRLTVYASSPGGESRVEAGSRVSHEPAHPVNDQAAPRRGPVMSPGARSLAAVGQVQKKKEVASDEAEEVAGRVAPTLRGWKKRKAQNEVQTLVLIALMFAVPIAVLEAFVINAQSENIAFANKELDGYRYAGPILAVASAVSLHSGLAARTLSGDADARSRMERAGSAVGEALKAAEQHGAAVREFGLQDPWPRISTGWAKLQAKLTGFTPEQSVAAHTELGDELS